MSNLPTWIKPQLCQLVKEAPSGDEWAHELKFDGYRMHGRLDRGDVRLLTRTGLDWTAKYPAIAAALRSFPVREAYLDGELCGVQPDGLTSFSLIQNATERRRGADLVYFVFDLLYLDGQNLMPLPLAVARRVLPPFSIAGLTLSGTAITRSGRGRHSIGMLARSALRASSRSDSMRLTAQASAGPGSKPNASTRRSSSSLAGPIPRVAALLSARCCSGTTTPAPGSSIPGGSARGCGSTSSKTCSGGCSRYGPTGCRSTSHHRARRGSAHPWCYRGSIGSGPNSSSRSSI